MRIRYSIESEEQYLAVCNVGVSDTHAARSVGKLSRQGLQLARGRGIGIADRAYEVVAGLEEFARDARADVARRAGEKNGARQRQRPSMVRATSSRMISEEPP